jgi:hypothetical protein
MGRHLFLLAAGALFFMSCGKCENEPPTVALVNHGSGKADIQVKTSGGNTENINNIYPDASSERRTFAPGIITFTIAIQGVDQSVVYELQTDNCNDYDVVISSDNTVNSAGTPREK